MPVSTPVCRVLRSSSEDAPLLVITLANCWAPGHHLMLSISPLSKLSRMAPMSNLSLLSSTCFVECTASTTLLLSMKATISCL